MAVATDRVIVRPPAEADRSRFVELFTSEAFMVYAGRHDVESANARFDHMLEMVDRVPYAKQPIVERASGVILGYTGVDTVSFDGVEQLEWGWRLVAGARGRGLATEAAAALLSLADVVDSRDVLCLIDPGNIASRRVADKVGFRWQRRVDWQGDPDAPTDVLVRSIGARRRSAQTPLSPPS